MIEITENVRIETYIDVLRIVLTVANVLFILYSITIVITHVRDFEAQKL